MRRLGWDDAWNMIFYRGSGARYTSRSVTVEGQQVPKSSWAQGYGSSAL